MKIYSINPMIFTAKKYPIRNSDLTLAPEKFTKKNFYEQIDAYLKGKSNKEEYMKGFYNSLDKIIEQKSVDEYTQLERQYMRQLESLADKAEDLRDIPDSYFKNNMLELLKYKK